MFQNNRYAKIDLNHTPVDYVMLAEEKFTSKSGEFAGFKIGNEESGKVTLISNTIDTAQKANVLMFAAMSPNCNPYRDTDVTSLKSPNGSTKYLIGNEVIGSKLKLEDGRLVLKINDFFVSEEQFKTHLKTLRKLSESFVQLQGKETIALPYEIKNRVNSYETELQKAVSVLKNGNLIFINSKYINSGMSIYVGNNKIGGKIDLESNSKFSAPKSNFLLDKLGYNHYLKHEARYFPLTELRFYQIVSELRKS
jgi:hypothetical protein